MVFRVIVIKKINANIREIIKEIIKQMIKKIMKEVKQYLEGDDSYLKDSLFLLSLYLDCTRDNLYT